MRIRTSGAELEVRVDFPPAGPVAPPLLLLNSLGADLSMWDPVVPALAAHRQLVRHDMRGHGGSSAGAGPCTVEELAADVIGLLEALDLPRADLCGLSLGGMVAATVAARAPERVRALVLCNTAARMGRPEVYAARAEAVRRGGMAVVVDQVLEVWFTPAFRTGHPAEVERARGMLLAQPPEGYAAACGAVGGVDLREVLPAVRARTLVVVGEADHATPPSDGEVVAAIVRGARLAAVPAAHLSSLEAGEALAAAILRFLEEP
jgi:3-oxoadipate enol-lactonase